MPRSREPDYSLGRFFVSPVLGCPARCGFCYIFSEGYEGKATANAFGVNESLQWIERHENFRPGRSGPIISIGAWGDPFPRGREDLHRETVDWLRAVCTTGNPIQIMSRFRISDSIIDAVASCQTFQHQILFSTSISTLKKWRDYEPGSDSPEDRLSCLNSFHRRGIAVNVMIKPFLPGVTDHETAEIGQSLLDAGIEYCVVGSLHWNNEILTSLERVNDSNALTIVSSAQNEAYTQLFDCTSTTTMHAFRSSTLDGFIHSLSSKGIRVFKKSACVNSHLLNEKNAALLFENDLDAFCVRCGVCDNSNFVELLVKDAGAEDDVSVVQQTVDYVRRLHMGESTGHDWWHIFRVWKLALYIGKAEGADLYVVQLASLLHDLDDWKLHDYFTSVGPEVAEKWLRKTNVGDKVTDHVLEIIRGMSFKGAGVITEMRTLEGKVVQDADRLDAIGAIGVARTFAYGGHTNRPMYDPERPPERHESFASYQANDGPIINHFYEKLLLLKDRMNTHTALRIANERHEFMTRFIRQFLHEWSLADSQENSP